MVRCLKLVAAPMDPDQDGASRDEIVERMLDCSPAPSAKASSWSAAAATALADAPADLHGSNLAEGLDGALALEGLGGPSPHWAELFPAAWW